jgi:predicted nucleotidyltransferase component of viral defense system
MDIELVNKIKRLAIIALASDDELVESLVLKGGNAIDLAYRSKRDTVSRASYDLDYSIDEGDFTGEIEEVSKRIENTLKQTFLEDGYSIIDYKFLNKPKNIQEELSEFWGGYKVEFKVISQKYFEEHKGNIDRQRRVSIPLNPNHSPVFELEFSKYEYVGQKRAINIDGFKIYVYTPEMIVFEKLRAICQQLPEYVAVIPSFNARPRARDFYDIHLIQEMHDIDPSTEENKRLIADIFRAKKVPLSFIKKIRENMYLHKDNWQSVQDTISAYENLQQFDYYFNFVLQKFEYITFP